MNDAGWWGEEKRPASPHMVSKGGAEPEPLHPFTPGWKQVRQLMRLSDSAATCWRHTQTLLSCLSAGGWEKRFQQETYVSEGREGCGARKMKSNAMERDVDLIKARWLWNCPPHPQLRQEISSTTSKRLCPDNGEIPALEVKSVHVGPLACGKNHAKFASLIHRFCFPKRQQGSRSPKEEPKPWLAVISTAHIFKCTTKGIPRGWEWEMLQTNCSPLRSFSLETFVFTLQPILFPDILFKLKEHFQFNSCSFK